MTFVRSKNISLKHQRFTTLGSKDIGIRKLEFVAKIQFLWYFFEATKITSLVALYHFMINSWWTVRWRMMNSMMKSMIENDELYDNSMIKNDELYDTFYDKEWWTLW